MQTRIRNILAIISGVVLGGLVNMGLVLLGPLLIPPPEGVDMSTVEGMTAGMALLGPQHFLAPFLAHALGTLAGALLAYVIASSHKHSMAYIVGAFYLVGGLAAASMIPAPVWFVALDLIVAYLPMAWAATKLGDRYKRTESGDMQ